MSEHRVVNFSLLGVSAIVLLAVIAAGYFLRGHQQQRLSKYLASRSQQLADAGDWRKAKFYQQRYLQAHPQDFQARVRLVEIASELSSSREDVDYLLRLLYETIGLSGEGSSETVVGMRTLLAEKLLVVGDYQTAIRESQRVLDSKSSEHQPSARRVLALASCNSVPARGVVSEVERRERFGKVLPQVLEALASNSKDVTLAQTAAEIYRTYPLLAPSPGPSAAELADKIIDDLVASSAGDADALLARYRYRKRYLLPKAEDDLQAALAASPEHFEANLLTGLEYAATKDDAESVGNAKRHFEAAVRSKPTDERGYLALSQLLWRSGERSAAIETLESASRQLPPTVLATRFLLADYLLAEGEHEKSGEVVVALKSQVENQLARFPVQSRGQLTNRVRLLEARLDAARGDIASAISLFSAVADSPENETGSTASTEVSRQARLGASQLLATVGHWDQAGQELARLADRLAVEIQSADAQKGNAESLTDPGAVEGEYRRARLQAAEAFLRSGQPQEARSQIDMLGKIGSLPVDAIELRLVVELALQLDLQPQNRRWDEFAYLLERARSLQPESERVYFAELQQAVAVHLSNDSSARLADVIASGEKRFDKSPGYWRAAMSAYLRVDDVQGAERSVARFLDVEPDPMRKAEVKVSYLVLTNRLEEASAWLSEQIAQSQDPQKRSLRRLEVQVLSQFPDKSDALSKAVALAEAPEGNKEEVVLALELAASQQEWELAERLEARLAEQRMISPSDVDFYRAVRLIGTYEKLTQGQREELSKIVSRQRSERPGWRKGAALAAQYAEVRGDVNGAIQAYELAVTLGDRRPEVLERLTLHLYRTGEYDRAQQVIDRLYSGDGDLSVGAESLAISTAVKRQRIEDALVIARRSVEAHRNEVERRLWLYNVLLAAENPTEAASVLEEAREDFPDDELVWNAQFMHHLRGGLHEAARELLSQLPPSIAKDDYRRSLTIARGSEQLGDLAEAERSYAAALEIRPDDLDVRLSYANLLVRKNPQAAKEQFERILTGDPKNADARRKLAALLASSGAVTDWGKIDSLLADAGSGGEIADRRLRAVLLTRRGRNVQERASNCELARRILTGVVEDSGATPEDIDYLLLAGAYEQEGMFKREVTYFESARNQLRRLLERTDASDKYENLYLTYLLRTADELAKIPQAEGARQVFLRDASGRLEDLERRLTARGDAVDLSARQALIAHQTRLLRSEGRIDEALEKLAAYADRFVDTAEDPGAKARLVLGLASLYSLLEAYELAEPRYRELMELAPGARLLLSQSLVRQGKSADAVNLFLEQDTKDLSPKSAAVLAGILASDQAESEQYERAWPAISGAIEQHGDDVELLMSVAVLHVTRGDEDEAIRLFRRVIEVAPDHTLALNNLATLLGERESDRAEALQVVGRAIKVAGRNAALLDTQGTIQLRVGAVSEAIASLEESVASVDVDPRYYFHLSAAYLRSGRTADAANAFKEAKRRGIADAVLTAADQVLMQEIKASLDVSRTVSRKAS
ncbi:tetratricopeptide repeat protein [Botrimarina mediterranea]|uniref:tetratricopeptide repeat protein n=1 Tax=Botrimarina mediterranea TaxID=2528022 RepID=UPI00119D4E3B